MADIKLERGHTALLIADFYAEAMGKLEHSLSRDCTGKAVAVREAARKAGLPVLYSATVFRPGYPEIGERNKIFVPRQNAGGPAVSDPVAGNLEQALKGIVIPNPHPKGTSFGAKGEESALWMESTADSSLRSE